MNKRRLLKLADLLEADAKNKKGIKFDFGDWGTVSNLKEPLSCGTRACAMGLAGLSGAFRRAGLKCKIAKCGFVELQMGRETDPIEIAARLFDIDADDAFSLFIPGGGHRQRIVGSVAEKQVAKHIRDFVAGKAQP